MRLAGWLTSQAAPPFEGHLTATLAAGSSKIVNSRFVIALLPIALAACTTVRPNACRATSEPVTQELIYFGTQTPTGEVTPDQWTIFIDQVITPKLPSGFTIWSASGQWQSAAGGIVKEPSYVLSFVHPPELSQDPAVEQIIDTYKSRFQQEAVLRVTSRACMEL